MTASPPFARNGSTWHIWALAFLLLVTVECTAAHAAAPPSTRSAVPRTSVAAWLRSTAAFLVIVGAAGYIGYFGFFPRLLRKNQPSWPLDAWRQTTYGVWFAICAATLVFKGPLMAVLSPYLTGIFKNINNTLLNTLLPNFMEIVLIPLILLVGLVVIWNFRRDAAHRSRPA